MHLRTIFILLIAVSVHVHAREQAHDPWEVICQETKGFHDGDTLTCASGPKARGTFVVRLTGVDAPEVGQAYWRASRDGLRSLASNGTRASCYKTDQYGREVCRLYSPSGKDIAAEMLSAGLAWNAHRWSHEQTTDEKRHYEALESQARSARRGLWSESDAMEPYECRRRKSRRERCH